MSDAVKMYLDMPCVPNAQAVCLFNHLYAVSPIFANPFKLPKLKAKPCERLRIRMKPVTGPESPSFSTLKFASASSPIFGYYRCLA